MNVPSRFLSWNNLKKKTLLLFENFKANQIMTKLGFDPWSRKNTITIITILLLYFARNARSTFNSNYVIAIITIMAISLNWHRWKTTNCTNILKATSSKWNNELSNNLQRYIQSNNPWIIIIIKTKWEQMDWKFHK